MLIRFPLCLVSIVAEYFPWRCARVGVKATQLLEFGTEQYFGCTALATNRNNGNVFVAGQNRVLAFSSEGSLLNSFHSVTTPRYLAVTQSGLLIAVDTRAIFVHDAASGELKDRLHSWRPVAGMAVGKSLRLFHPSLEITELRLWDGKLVRHVPCQEFTGYEPDRGWDRSSMAVHPTTGETFVSNSEHPSILVFSNDGTHLRSIGNQRLSKPTGLAFDDQHNLRV